MNRCMQFEKDEDNIGYTLVSYPQSRDWLGKRESKNDAVSTYM